MPIWSQEAFVSGMGLSLLHALWQDAVRIRVSRHKGKVCVQKGGDSTSVKVSNGGRPTMLLDIKKELPPSAPPDKR